MSKPLTHLTASAVKAIHAEVLAAHGGSLGIREEALLESAVAVPQATMMGQSVLSQQIVAAFCKVGLRLTFRWLTVNVFSVAHGKNVDRAFLDGIYDPIITASLPKAAAMKFLCRWRMWIIS